MYEHRFRRFIFIVYHLITLFFITMALVMYYHFDLVGMIKLFLRSYVTDDIFHQIDISDKLFSIYRGYSEKSIFYNKYYRFVRCDT